MDETTPVPRDFYEKYPASVMIERFERLWTKIQEKWGTRDCVELLDELLVMEDDKQRQGFDFNVMSELLFLTELHARQYPEFAKPKLGDDIWNTDFTHE